MLSKSRRQQDHTRRAWESNLAKIVDLPNCVLSDKALSYDVHIWCVGLIRAPARRFSHQAEGAFSSIDDALDYIDQTNDFGEECILLGYNLDEEPSFRLQTKDALQALRKKSTLVSIDGAILANLHATSSFVLDYEEASENSSLSSVFCTVRGELGLSPRFPDS
jgi:hypothetical protein